MLRTSGVKICVVFTRQDAADRRGRAARPVAVMDVGADGAVNHSLKIGDSMADNPSSGHIWQREMPFPASPAVQVYREYSNGRLL